jgi:hypothetical protein
MTSSFLIADAAIPVSIIFDESVLPFLVEDAARSDAEIDASQSTDRPFPVSYYTTHGLS